MRLLSLNDRRSIILAVSMFCVAFSGGVLFTLLFHSLCTGLLVFTGVITVQTVIDIFHPKSDPVFPVPSGIFCGICMAFFFILLTMLVK